MTLSSLIRKRDTGGIATAIPAISATRKGEGGATVARIATVAVANPKEGQAAPPAKVGTGDTATASHRQPSTPMTVKEESAIRAWLALIEETDTATIAEVIERCQRDAVARAYFLGRAAAEQPKPDPFPDDRRTCVQCANLSGRGICLAAKRGDFFAGRNYQPVHDLPRRCEGYAPGPDDPDRRHGRERWQCLLRQGGNAS